MQQADDNKDTGAGKKERWYPGKYLTKAVKRASTGKPSSDIRGSFDKSVEENSESDIRESFMDIPSTQDPPTYSIHSLENNSVGKVRVKILELKYSRFQQTKIAVRVDGIKISNIVETQFPYERCFDLQSITSDVKIEVKGAVLPSTPTWREIYPFYDRSKRLDSLSERKFVSGLSDQLGSALNKPKFNMGFALVEVELILPSKSALGLYLLPGPKDDVAVSEQHECDLDQSESHIQMQQTFVQRDLDRLRSAALRVPALLSPFLFFPEVLILIGVFGCLCYSLQPYQIPIALFMGLLANGLMTNSSRSYAQVQVWNEPGTITSSAPAAEDEDNRLQSVAATAQLLRLTHFLACTVSFLAHEVEVMQNMLCFADPRVSTICFAVLLLLSLLASLWLCLFSVSSLVFLCGSLVLLVLSCGGFLAEQIELLPKQSIYYNIAMKAQKAAELFRALKAKVPDELEMQHRYIAGTAVTKENSMLMMDAATDFNTK